jgi:hypothetical protein
MTRPNKGINRWQCFSWYYSDNLHHNVVSLDWCCIYSIKLPFHNFSCTKHAYLEKVWFQSGFLISRRVFCGNYSQRWEMSNPPLTDHSPPSSTGVKNTWICTSTPCMSSCCSTYLSGGTILFYMYAETCRSLKTAWWVAKVLNFEFFITPLA